MARSHTKSYIPRIAIVLAQGIVLELVAVRVLIRVSLIVMVIRAIVGTDSAVIMVEP